MDRDQLDVDLIAAALAASSLWQDLIYRQSVGSTNDVAKELASGGAPEGTAVVAEEQTAGRGRLARRWVAPPGTSLLCSILFRPTLRPTQAHRLTMLCSMAAADAIGQLTSLAVHLKWPNDLIVDSRGSEPGPQRWHKLAGILTEAELARDNLDFVIVGIGINVNVPHEELVDLAPGATSVSAEAGHEVDRSALLVGLLKRVENRYGRLQRGENPHQEWSERLATLGREVRVRTAERSLLGVAEGVDADGALLLRTEDGSLERLLAADVTLAAG